MMKTNSGKYEGLNYQVNILDNGSNYQIFEYIPITHIKCTIQSGTSCDPKSYTEDKVKQIIKLIVKEAKEKQ